MPSAYMEDVIVNEKSAGERFFLLVDLLIRQLMFTEN